jgi:hypothetical protein
MPPVATNLTSGKSVLQRELHLARGCHPRHHRHAGIGGRPNDLEIKAGTHGEIRPCIRRLPHVLKRDDRSRSKLRVALLVATHSKTTSTRAGAARRQRGRHARGVHDVGVLRGMLATVAGLLWDAADRLR